MFVSCLCVCVCVLGSVAILAQNLAVPSARLLLPGLGVCVYIHAFRQIEVEEVALGPGFSRLAFVQERSWRVVQELPATFAQDSQCPLAHQEQALEVGLEYLREASSNP